MEEGPIIIDFTKLDESNLRALGYQIELMLKRMFGLNELNFKIRGPGKFMNSFFDSIEKEKSYIEAFKEFGLDDPKTWESRYKLERSIKNFERASGIKWPLR